MRSAPTLAAVLLGACASTESASTPKADAAPDGAGESFCYSRPVLQFCEDFDRGPLPGRFGAIDARGGTVGVDQSASTSAPASMLAVLGVASGAARVTQTFDAGSRIRAFAQVRLEQRGEGAHEGPVEIVGLELAGGYALAFATNARGEWFGVQRRRDGAGATVIDRFPATHGVSPGVWTSIRVDVDLVEAGAGRMTIRVGDDSVVEGVAIAAPAGSAAPTVSFGLSAAETEGRWAVRYDTITFEVR